MTVLATGTDRKIPIAAYELSELARSHGWAVSHFWGTTAGYTPYYRLAVAVRSVDRLGYCHAVMVWHTETYPAVYKLSTKVYRFDPSGPWSDMNSLKMISNLIRSGSRDPST